VLTGDSLIFENTMLYCFKIWTGYKEDNRLQIFFRFAHSKHSEGMAVQYLYV